MHKLKDKERTQIINALRTGVVPAIGLRHIQVGRVQEVSEIVKDLDHISAGGATVRFIAGEFGSGKSFFLSLTKLIAHEKKMIVMNADITTEKILCSSDGKARSLLTELLKNISHKSKIEGGGLKNLIETWIQNFLASNSTPNENDFYKALEPISHLSLCQTFATVLFKYFEAFNEGNLAGIEKCLKWFRAEYETKTEAKNEIAVNRIIEDGDFYDVLKIFAGFTKLAGFSGLVIAIDELAVLIRQKAPQRSRNYETLLTIINDCLQGSVQHVGFIFGATSEAIENKERGLFSYGALETRLAASRFAKGAIKDLTGPILQLVPLSKEELYVLLIRLRDIHSNFEPTKWVIPDNGVEGYFKHIFSQMGAEAHLNPRDVIREYLGLLTILENNPDKKWFDLISVQNEQTIGTSTGLVKLKVN